MYWVVQCRAEWGQKEAAALWQISAISHRKSGISLIYTDPSWNRYLQIILCKILHLFPTNVQHLTFISLVINSEEIGRVLCPVQDGIVMTILKSLYFSFFISTLWESTEHRMLLLFVGKSCIINDPLISLQPTTTSQKHSESENSYCCSEIFGSRQIKQRIS